MTTVNLNDKVEVVLTEVGAKTLSNYFKYREYKEGDTYRDQLWSIIEIFKDTIGLGLMAPFKECLIYLEGVE